MPIVHVVSAVPATLPEVRTPEQAIEKLMTLVRGRTDELSPEGTRSALADVLAQLETPAEEIDAWANGVDVFGVAYERLLTGAQRRDAGQFQTPFWAADLMAAWLLREPVKLLLDPGVGAGRLLFRAGIRDPAPERLLGLDLDAVSCAMARANLTLRDLGERAEVRQADFLLDDLAEQPDAISCNPPYSRHHAIAAEVKAAIHDGFEERVGVKLSRLAALHALFLIRSIEVAAPGARIAFITPGDWLDTNYGRSIKAWVLEQANVEALVLFPEGALPFGETVMSSAVITLLRKTPRETRPKAGSDPPRSKHTRVVQLPAKLPTVEAALAAATGEATKLRVAEVDLAAASKWSRPANVQTSGTPLSELATIRRGIATGNNKFFVLSEQARRAWNLPLDELRPCLATPRVVEGLEVEDLALLPDDAPRWVLACWRPEAEDENTPLGAYLRHGRTLGAADTYLASKRKPWHGLDKREAPAILWPYFNRDRIRFVRNRADALPLNNWLGITPHGGVDADKLWRLLNKPSSIKAVVASRRSYAGMTKLEPRELGAVQLRWR
jgi:adenine-specific DNA-methyltransferase